MAAATYFDQVQQLYIAYFGRPADTIGQAYWAGIIDAANGNIAAVQAGFSASTESQALFGNKSTIDKVTAIYQNVFNRAPEPAGLAFWVAQLDSGKVTQAQASWTIQQNAGPGDAATVQNKLTAAKAFTAQIDTTAEITAYQGTNAADLARAFLKTVTSDNATATAAVANAATSVAGVVAAGGAVGSTFALTTATDNLTGTSSNDLFIADAGTSSAADQVNGGAGTDTFKTFEADPTKLPSLKNIEVLQVAATLTNAAVDLSGVTKAATGVEKFVLDNVAALNAKTITTGAGQALSLSTGAAGEDTAGTVTWAGSATDTALNLTLNGYQSKGTSAQGLTVTGALANTLNITSSGAANKVGTFTGPATVTKHVITGEQAFTYALAAADAAKVATIDASAATGAISADVSAGTQVAAFAFTGGSAADKLSITAAGLQALTSGAQIDGGAGKDTIALTNAAYTLVAKDFTALNAAKNIEVLGLAGAGTVDASKLSTIKEFSVTTGTNVINGVATGSILDIDAATIKTTVTAQQGVQDLTINIGSASATTATANTALEVSGLTNLTVNANIKAGVTGQSHLLSDGVTSLKLSDNSSITVKGNGDLTIDFSKVAAAPTQTGFKVDASASTGVQTLVGNKAIYAANSTLGDILIGGSANDVITASVNSSKLTGNGGNDTFNVSAAVAGATTNATITTITDFTKGDKIVFGATAGNFTAAKVDLSAAANEQAAIDALVAGSNSDVKWGVYNGATYVADDVGTGATLAATDTVVKLAGVLDLSTSTFAANTLTFA